MPSGVSMWIVHSPMSSFGTNVRPTIRLSGNVMRNTPIEIAMTTPEWSSAQTTHPPYHWSSQWKKPASFVL